LGVIPGPHSPKHINSFLHPFVEECIQGVIGIPTYHSQRATMFDLRFYPINGIFDGPAMSKANGCKDSGAILPCHECPIEGIRDRSKKGSPYYLPHQRPDDDESQTDDLLANLKTHEYYIDAWRKLSEAETVKEAEEIQREYGIVCIPALGILPSMDIVMSFPFGFMHLLFENNAPGLVQHWKGTYKKISSPDDEYALDEETWEDIGKETADAARTIPALMARATPDIWTQSCRYTAESWAFWITWQAPYVMKDRLPGPHYQHLLLFGKIIKLATSLEITPEMLEELDQSVREWHATYEELYYRYDMDRISACPLNVHAMIHISNDTRHAGPLSRIWEYVTERFMGQISRSIKSRRYPFAQLSETVKKREQMKLVIAKYGLENELIFGAERRDWFKLSGQEMMFPEINGTTVLKSPTQADFAWPADHQMQVAIYFKQALQLRASAQRIKKELPSEVFRWGKFRVLGEKGVVSSEWAQGRLSSDMRRDSSFVRVELLADSNAHDASLPDVPQQQVYYGQLLYVVHVSLKKDSLPGVTKEEPAILGIVQWCEGAVGDASLSTVWYKKMGVIQAVNIATIQCVVGRQPVGNRWGIIDLNYGCASTTFVDPQGEGDAGDDGNGFDND
ncbi:hypothetical protein M408DRAFT_110138, partial [Serendipita vermifera MAFF 305830]